MSKKTEAIKNVREMGDDELREHVRQQRRRLFELRFQQATGQVENHRQVRVVRREIARALTVDVEHAKGILAPVPVLASVAVSEPRRRRGAAADAAETAPQQPRGDAEGEEPARRFTRSRAGGTRRRQNPEAADQTALELEAAGETAKDPEAAEQTAQDPEAAEPTAQEPEAAEQTATEPETDAPEEPAEDEVSVSDVEPGPDDDTSEVEADE